MNRSSFNAERRTVPGAAAPALRATCGWLFAFVYLRFTSVRSDRINVQHPRAQATWRRWGRMAASFYLRGLFIALAGVCLLASPSACAQARREDPGNWPCYRGPDRMGIAPAGNEGVPLEWSDMSNIVWKTPLVGRGSSSPIVWGDNVYVTAFTGYGLEKGDAYSNVSKLARHVFCVDRKTGAIRWKHDLPSQAPHEHGVSEYLALHGYASSTPVADELGIYVYLGREGILALDHTGKQRWRISYEPRHHIWGAASSPILFENLLIVHADPEVQAVLALDKATGREVWRAKTGNGDSWSTPLIYEVGGRQELVFHHTDAYHQQDKRSVATVAAVNPRTGEPLWQCDILKSYLCPSPIQKDGVVYWIGQPSAAVRAGGMGEVSASHILWRNPRGSEICTPILHEGHLYFVNEASGVAYCIDAKTGADVYQQRLEPAAGRIYASGVLVGDRIYYVSRENGTYVVEAKPKFRLLAHNRIASDTSIANGTPAISRGQMFLRSDAFLYCIGKK
jgi:outer membrane protein assembly factor BamB